METSLPLPIERNLFFSKDVDSDSIEELSRAIVEINENDSYLKKLYNVYDLEYKPSPIIIRIDSVGGLVYPTMGLLGIMDRSETPIHTIATGAAMSCAFMILIHGHKRFAYKHALPMYHQVSSFSYGTYQEIKENLEETKRLQKAFEKMVIEKTKITKEKLKEIVKTKLDWHISPKEALKFGVVDEIL